MWQYSREYYVAIVVLGIVRYLLLTSVKERSIGFYPAVFIGYDRKSDLKNLLVHGPQSDNI
jgi:hypothetical protein